MSKHIPENKIYCVRKLYQFVVNTATKKIRLKQIKLCSRNTHRVKEISHIVQNTATTDTSQHYSRKKNFIKKTTHLKINYSKQIISYKKSLVKTKVHT